MSAAEQRGEPFDVIKGGILRIDGERFTLQTASGSELGGTLKVDNGASPGALDFLLSSGEVWLAIFTATSDSLRLNYVEAAPGTHRPTEFAAAGDAGEHNAAIDSLHPMQCWTTTWRAGGAPHLSESIQPLQLTALERPLAGVSGPIV